MSTKPTTVPTFSMYPNDGSANKPIYVTISDRSLNTLQKAFSGRRGGTGGMGGDGEGGAAGITDNFRSMLKHLAGIGIMVTLLRKMEANSTVLNAYQAGMGKMFGAVMDVLLLPFMPIFNLIIIAINKLLIWFFRSGNFERLSKLMEQVAKNLETVAQRIKELIDLFKARDWGKLFSVGWKDVQEGIAYAIKHPIQALATAGVVGALGAKVLGRSMIGGFFSPVTGPFKYGWKGGRAGWRKWRGRKAPKGSSLKAPSSGGVQLGLPGFGGPSAPVGGRGAGTMSALGKLGGQAMLAYGVGEFTGMVSQSVLGYMGVGQKKANIASEGLKYAAMGATFGAAFGPWGALAGGLGGGAYGLWKGWRDNKKKPSAESAQEMAGGYNINNSYNTFNVYVNSNSMNSNQLMGDVGKAIQDQTGFNMKTGTGTMSTPTIAPAYSSASSAPDNMIRSGSPSSTNSDIPYFNGTIGPTPKKTPTPAQAVELRKYGIK